MRNSSQGRLADFRVTRAASSLTWHAARESAAGGLMHNRTLLLVEDNELVSAVAEDALEAGGYGVVHTRSGDEAMTQLNDPSARFAGLITDIDLGPNPDGWEVARHAREIRPDMPVVYTTGHAGADWPVHGVPNSVLVQKPYAPAQLLTAISALITAADTHRTS